MRLLSIFTVTLVALVVTAHAGLPIYKPRSELEKRIDNLIETMKYNHQCEEYEAAQVNQEHIMYLINNSGLSSDKQKELLNKVKNAI
ncbi:hypothetical protein IWQ60_009955 [Tieghemiomyces parasiticus]|uniref:Uncharacterized protein n=1 Tax=Tieghemiomyces parasiticus TaxID=78921 RepID=A0A9W8DKC0_9FUNG|nr:hypothetical protein IWQ60_009955 [Tieghemiomyces parasiticus]